MSISIYLYAWTLLGEIENLRLNEIPDIWNGLFLNIQPLLRILTVWNIHINVSTWLLKAVFGICLCSSGCCGDREWEDLIMYAWPPMFENAFSNITFITTEGALRLPMIYDNHPIPSTKPPYNHLNWPWLISVDQWPPMTDWLTSLS